MISSDGVTFERLAAHLTALQQCAAGQHERALQVYVVAGAVPLDATKQEVDSPDVAIDRADRITRRLGLEQLRCLHDARRLVDPALLAADIGTLRTGGLMVLLISAADTTRYTRRLRRLLTCFVKARPAMTRCEPLHLDALDALARLCNDDAPPVSQATAPDTPARRTDSSRNRSDDPDSIDSNCTAAIREQDAMLESLQHYVLGGSRRVAVVEGARGRGKSALLGRLAARLDTRLDTRDMTLALMAARQSAAGSLQRHYALDSGNRPSDLNFLATDEALRSSADLLFIDEAANLSLPTVRRLLARFPRIVMATTTDGHESAGRAFALRLPAMLDEAFPDWQRFSPQEPFRWRKDDSLEKFFATVLAIHTTGPADARIGIEAGTRVAPKALHPSERINATSASIAHPVDVQAVDRNSLADDDALLETVYGLLSTTHYQSTLIDLAHLLDAPGLRLWSASLEANVVGIVAVVIEPGIPTEMQGAVLARRRRPPHRLLPALLAQSADSGAALAANYARVLRIAVHPDLRRQGIASRLLDETCRTLANDVEAIGASFGENAVSNAFWRSNDFEPFHRGYRQNPRSGQHSLAVLKANTARTRTVLAKAASIHRENREFQRLPVGGLLVRPLARADRADTPASLSVTDAQILARFVQAERPLSDTLAALDRLIALDQHAPPSARQALATGDAPALLSALGLEVPVSRKLVLAVLREWAGDRLDTARIGAENSLDSV